MRLPGRSAEPSLDWLVVGLGNPGARYRATRHNAGYMVVDRIAERLDGGWRSRFSGLLCELRDGDQRVALLKPQTYMNDSGRSVSAALRFYKLPPERLLVVHDEIDLQLGDVRAKLGGGLAGHNGLRSVVQHMGTQDFARVRLGVGRPERGDPRPVVDWVLTPFEPHVDVDGLIDRGVECTLVVLREGIEAALAVYR
ncbi:MAG: aminoacyl-tRNA hydrolase [Gaiellales bacterium]